MNFKEKQAMILFSALQGKNSELKVLLSQQRFFVSLMEKLVDTKDMTENIEIPESPVADSVRPVAEMIGEKYAANNSRIDSLLEDLFRQMTQICKYDLEKEDARAEHLLEMMEKTKDRPKADVWAPTLFQDFIDWGIDRFLTSGEE
jgi:hypothetical protein